MKRILLIGGMIALAACEPNRASQDAPSTVDAASPSANESVEAPLRASEPQTDGAIPAKSAQAAAEPKPALTPVVQYSTQSRPLVEEVPPSRAAGGIYTPRPGMAERTELMNAIRAATRNDLGTPAVFLVHNLRSNGQWAFGQLTPQHPDGRPITLEATPFYRTHKGQALDGLRMDVIWRKQGGRWQVFAHEIGATDVWYLAYCGRLPRGVIPGC